MFIDVESIHEAHARRDVGRDTTGREKNIVQECIGIIFTKVAFFG